MLTIPGQPRPGRRDNSPKVFSLQAMPRPAIARKSPQIGLMIAKTLFLT
jgi:hypothetical protein